MIMEIVLGTTPQRIVEMKYNIVYKALGRVWDEVHSPHQKKMLAVQDNLDIPLPLHYKNWAPNAGHKDARDIPCLW
jgi:hypothetical protein